MYKLNQIQLKHINNKSIPAHVGAVVKSPIPSLSESWHIRISVPVIWNPLLHEAVHVALNAVLAAQSVFPPVIAGGESQVIAVNNRKIKDPT